MDPFSSTAGMAQPFASRWEWEVGPSEPLTKQNNFEKTFDFAQTDLSTADI